MWKIWFLIFLTRNRGGEFRGVGWWILDIGMLAAEIAMATDMTDIRVYAHWPGMTEPEWNAMETATRAGNSFSAMASASGFT
jgi:uncharacterized membrane protein